MLASGASSTGSRYSSPANLARGAACSTLRSTRGRNAMPSSDLRLRSTVVSVSAPPTTKSQAASESFVLASAISSVVVCSAATAASSRISVVSAIYTARPSCEASLAQRPHRVNSKLVSGTRELDGAMAEQTANLGRARQPDAGQTTVRQAVVDLLRSLGMTTV